MATKFTVIQYVPNPVAGERINIGIMAWNETDLKLAFVSDFSRAKRLAGSISIESIEQVKDYLAAFENQPISEAVDIQIKNMINESQNLVQFKPVSVTRSSPADALSQLFPLFINDTRRRAFVRRGRTFAVNLLAKKAEDAALRVWNDRELINHALKVKVSVEGELTNHKAAFTLQNGELRLIGLADSMETDMTEDRKGKLLFDAQDLRRSCGDVAMTCLLFPPRQPNEQSEDSFRDTVNLLHRLQITTINENQVDAALEGAFRNIPLSELRH